MGPDILFPPPTGTALPSSAPPLELLIHPPTSAPAPAKVRADDASGGPSKASLSRRDLQIEIEISFKHYIPTSRLTHILGECTVSSALISSGSGEKNLSSSMEGPG